MAPKKGENTKKAAGNAKKAEVAAQKQAVRDAENERAESAKWQQGSKSTAKKYGLYSSSWSLVPELTRKCRDAAADKAAEAQRKRDEKAALLAEEERNAPSKARAAGAKTAQKKTNAAPKSNGLDLSQLDFDAPASTKSSTLNASGIDNALDALSLTRAPAADKIDRHPERRVRAAYTAFEERRLDEMKDDKQLRRQQKIDIIRKEFEKSPENPMNNALAGRFDMSKEEMQALRDGRRDEVEKRLGGS